MLQVHIIICIASCAYECSFTSLLVSHQVACILYRCNEAVQWRLGTDTAVLSVGLGQVSLCYGYMCIHVYVYVRDGF